MSSESSQFTTFIVVLSEQNRSPVQILELVVLNVVLYVQILVYFLGNSQCSVQRVSNSSHQVVCHVQNLQAHLRTGSHNCVGAVGAVSDKDILTSGLLEVQVVLYLSRADTRTLALSGAVLLLLEPACSSKPV